MPLTRPDSQTDARMLAAEDRFAALLDAAVDGILVIDAQGLVRQFNRTAEVLFGYSAAEVIGQNVSLLMPEPDRLRHNGYLRRYHRTGQAKIIGIGREVIAQRKDGTTFPIELSVGEFQNDAGHGFVGILRDITQRRQEQEQLRRQTHEAEELRDRLAHVGRLGMLGEMVSGIAHEVNQPLTAIATYAHAARRLLTSGQSTPGELVGTLEKIAAQAERAGHVIRGLRNFVRKRDAVREPLDCNALVREVAGLVDFELRQSGFRLVLRLADDLPETLGDGVQLQQVFLNLIRNGLDAMLEQAHGDSVTVSTRAADGGCVEIEVSDQGAGIPAAVTHRLFEPFFTTKPQGIGLGLSICKSIVSVHGGDLRFAKNEPDGTTVTVRLPVRGAS